MSVAPETAVRGPCVVPVHRVVERLCESPNVCDQRKSRDVGRLQALADGPWSDRVVLVGIDCGRQWSLDLVVQLDVAGLAWRGRAEPHRPWTMLVAVPHNYPMAMPAVRFVGGVVPYCPHVIHREFLPDEARLPVELRQFVEAVRAGRDGACCYLRGAQWSPLTTHDLAMVVWQVGRILTGTRLFGEQGSLNNHARDHYQRLQDEGRLPLGPGLPAPWSASDGGRTGPDGSNPAGELDDVDDAIAWTHES